MNRFFQALKPPLSRSNLLALFLTVAFPVHLWAIIIFILEIPDIESATELFDAVGMGSYTLLFALVESLVIFLGLMLLSYLLPKRWPEDKILAALGLVLFITLVWAIANQLFSLVEFTPITIIFPSSWTFMGNPYVLKFAIRFITEFIPGVIIGATLAYPLWVLEHKANLTSRIITIIESIGVLSMLYLLLDLIGIGVILWRNV